MKARVQLFQKRQNKVEKGKKCTKYTKKKKKNGNFITILKRHTQIIHMKYLQYALLRQDKLILCLV